MLTTTALLGHPFLSWTHSRRLRWSTVPFNCRNMVPCRHIPTYSWASASAGWRFSGAWISGETWPVRTDWIGGQDAKASTSNRSRRRGSHQRSHFRQHQPLDKLPLGPRPAHHIGGFGAGSTKSGAQAHPRTSCAPGRSSIFLSRHRRAQSQLHIHNIYIYCICVHA